MHFMNMFDLRLPYKILCIRCLKPQKFISFNSRSWTSEVRVPAWKVLLEALFLACTWQRETKFSDISYKDTDPNISVPQSCPHIIELPQQRLICKYHREGQVGKALIYQFWENTHSVHNIIITPLWAHGVSKKESFT